MHLVLIFVNYTKSHTVILACLALSSLFNGVYQAKIKSSCTLLERLLFIFSD